MKAHRTDGVSLTFAVIFLALAAWWLAAQVAHLQLPAVGWIAASTLILLGMFGLLGALRSGRSAASEIGSATPDGTPTSGGPAEPTSGFPFEPTTGSPLGGTGWPGAASPYDRGEEG